MSYSILDHVREDRIREALRINGDNSVELEIDWDGSDFRDTWCDIFSGVPAAVHVNYTRDEGRVFDPDYVSVEAAYSWSAARDAIAWILDDERVDHDQMITVRVNAHALVYTLTAAA